MNRPARQPASIRPTGAPDAPPSSPLASLAVLANAVATGTDLRAIYRALFDFACAISPTEGIFVALYDPATRLRTCVYSAGPGREDDVSTFPVLPLSGSPQSQAIETGAPVVTTDLQTLLDGKPGLSVGIDVDPRLPQSSVAVPMVVLGRTIGALEVQSLEADPYTSEHVAAMVMAAGIAGLAIERMRAAEPTGMAAAASRRQIRTIIRETAFSIVFQPIVELGSRAVVGYEALTRFSDGTAPALRFSQADSVGLGLELEAATLEAAVRASAALPANAWLNLNVSPALVMAGNPLASIVRDWGWQVVLEMTEHAAVADYDDLRRAIAALGDTVRIAIDDAGAGFASFRHILELRPHFVKIDRAIVGGIDGDPSRQALVAGMRHFAVTTGCALIAEGIETDSELRALRELGISLGQGYLLGRPSPAR